jgi:hypothetical protein
MADFWTGLSASNRDPLCLLKTASYSRAYNHIDGGQSWTPIHNKPSNNRHPGRSESCQQRLVRYRRNGGSGPPDPPSTIFAGVNVRYYCEHKDAARALSAGVGTKGGPSTFDPLAFAISVVASDGRRKRWVTALFAAAVTTQTYPS